MGVLDQFRLNGKRALITGASKGLGLEMARGFAEAGAEVVLVSRSEDNLKQAVDELSAIGPKIYSMCFDVGNPADAEEMCREALRRFDAISILVNNVGGRRINIPTEEFPLADWQKIVDLNLTSAFICTKMLGGAMLPRKHGRVINISSISASLAGKQMRGRSYETCKAALSMFTKAVAGDWAQHGVTVNAIAPGTFLTDANRRWIRERPELKGEIEAAVPLGRLGDPKEIAPLAVYLASDASSFMTGSVIVIDGGRLLW